MGASRACGLGLGTGSTAKHFVELLAERVRGGLEVVGVPTSEATRAQAERLGMPLTTLDETPELDMTVDGADEIGPDLTLIKGGGGALLREKIVAAASARMVVIADESKWVDSAGPFPAADRGDAVRLRGDPARGRGGGGRRRLPGPDQRCARARTATLSSRMAATGYWMPRSTGSPMPGVAGRAAVGASRASSSTVSLSGWRKPSYSPARRRSRHRAVVTANLRSTRSDVIMIVRPHRPRRSARARRRLAGS